MKTTAIYFTLILILSSCGMSKNFNRQKFTSLKKIKSTEVVHSQQNEESEEIVEEIETTIDYEEEVFTSGETEDLQTTSDEQSFFESTDKNDLRDDLSESPEEYNTFYETDTERTESPTPLNKENRRYDDGGKSETDRLLTTNTIVFFIGLVGIIVQFLAFIALLLLEAEAILSFSWVPLMSVSLIGGLVGVGCLFAAFIIAMIYKKRCKKNGVEPKRGRWYSMWITALILGIFFLGNLVVTGAIFVFEFFA